MIIADWSVPPQCEHVQSRHMFLMESQLWVEGIVRAVLPSCPRLGVYPYTEWKSHLSFETYYHGPCSFAKKQRGTPSYWMKFEEKKGWIKTKKKRKLKLEKGWLNWKDTQNSKTDKKKQKNIVIDLKDYVYWLGGYLRQNDISHCGEISFPVTDLMWGKVIHV